jgi:hypothetical protein
MIVNAGNAGSERKRRERRRARGVATRRMGGWVRPLPERIGVWDGCSRNLSFVICHLS